MIPDKMHIALASNIHTDVDWKLVVFWVACLEFYEAQTKADRIERDEDQLGNLEKQKKRAAEHNLCVQEAKKAKKAVNNYIVEEKAAVHATQIRKLTHAEYHTIFACLLSIKTDAKSCIEREL